MVLNSKVFRSWLRFLKFSTGLIFFHSNARPVKYRDAHSITKEIYPKENLKLKFLFPFQVIGVALMANSWLHTGSLVCPACQDICGEQFAKQGQRCKPGVLPPKNHVYYEESLPCSAPSHFHTSLSTVLLISCSLIILSSRIALWDKNKLWLFCCCHLVYFCLIIFEFVWYYIPMPNWLIHTFVKTYLKKYNM